MWPYQDKERRRSSGLIGLLFIPAGVFCTVIAVRHVWALEHPWTSNSLHWAGVFIGPLSVGIGCMAVWRWLFPQKLTPEQQRVRDLMEGWQEERRRIFGDDV